MPLKFFFAKFLTSRGVIPWHLAVGIIWRRFVFVRQ